MSFFGNLLGKKKTESVALVEVGPDSVAAAFAYFKEGQVPLIVYAKREPIEIAKGETPSAAAARTLAVLGERLIHEGAPYLVRIAGSGRIDSVVASVKAPWQETIVRSEKIERTSPFVFTKALLATALEKSATAPPGRLLADEFVVGSVLDGYTVTNPVGKRANRVSVIVLSSFIDEALSLAVATVLRKLFHTRAIRLVAAAALRYEALRAVFPHEEDYLTVDVAGDSVVTTLIRRGLLSAVEHASVAEGGKDKGAWLPALTQTLEAITKRYPLPRKVLLLAGEGERTDLKQKIELAPLASLRLSDEPPIVVAIQPSQLTEQVRVAPEGTPDLGLELMGIFWRGAEH